MKHCFGRVISHIKINQTLAAKECSPICLEFPGLAINSSQYRSKQAEMLILELLLVREGLWILKRY